MSLIGTFAVMVALRFRLNNRTLFGLVLAIGIVADDAIVVPENIEHHSAAGLDARATTIKAMSEITGPISVFLSACSVRSGAWTCRTPSNGTGVAGIPHPFLSVAGGKRNS
jgi:hypothetical protein